MVAHTREGHPITFYHPAVQSTFMFLGEFLCLLPFLLQFWHRHRRGANTSTVPFPDVPVQGRTSRRPLVASGSLHAPLLDSFPAGSEYTHSSSGAAEARDNKLRTASRAVFVLALPTLCDAASTMLMNVGLYYTSASVFQMLRGTVVFFAGAHFAMVQRVHSVRTVFAHGMMRFRSRSIGHHMSHFFRQSKQQRFLCQLPFQLHAVSESKQLLHCAAIFTMLILRRRLHLHHWQGMMLIAVGAFVVGLSSVLHTPARHPPRRHHHHHHDYKDYTDYDYNYEYQDDVDSLPPASLSQRGLLAISDAVSDLLTSGHVTHGHRSSSSDSSNNSNNSNPLLGNLFVMAAQIFTALQFVVEEKSVKQYRMPALLAVGLEGFWGLVLSCAYLPLFLHVKVRIALRTLPAPCSRCRGCANVVPLK